ncbi:MAG TPA: NAD(P)-binding domain-containing protein, partial [Nitrosopumilaceae archaeon]|nr:NAD(P)-binding domain-containing protein [Nitrosopumilaceae archaeon]
MNSKISKKIVLIGTGNLGHHLAKLFVKKGHEIIQIVSRSEVSAKAMGLSFFTSHTSDINALNPNADIYILCVSDNEIEKVASHIKIKNKLLIHTSGSTDIQVLAKSSNKYGVLYPLQTFSKKANTKWSKTPLLIEGNNKDTETLMKTFADSLCNEVHVLNSEQ